MGRVAIGRAQQTFPHLAIWDQNDRLSVLPPEKIERRYYLRFNVADRPHVIADITDILGRNMISLASVIQHESPELDALSGNGAAVVPLVIMTHRTTEGQMRAASAQLEQLDVICGRYVRLPVAD